MFITSYYTFFLSNYNNMNSVIIKNTVNLTYLCFLSYTYYTKKLSFIYKIMFLFVKQTPVYLNLNMGLINHVLFKKIAIIHPFLLIINLIMLIKITLLKNPKTPFTILFYINFNALITGMF